MGCVPDLLSCMTGIDLKILGPIGGFSYKTCAVILKKIRSRSLIKCAQTYVACLCLLDCITVSQYCVPFSVQLFAKFQVLGREDECEETNEVPGELDESRSGSFSCQKHIWFNVF